MAIKMEEEQIGFLDELLGGPTSDVPTEPAEIEQEVQVNEEEQKETLEVQQPSESVPQQEQPANEEDYVSVLREQIVKLTEQLGADPLRQSVQEKVPERSEQSSSDAPKAQTLQNFLTPEELDRVIDEPDVLNKAFERAISVMQQNMQGVIQAEVNRQVMVSRAVTDFYTANQDLAPYGKFVQFVMAEIEQTNSDKTYAEIFDMTAKESRRRLGLGQSSTVPDRQKSQVSQQRPAFAGSKRGTQRPAGKQDFFDPNAADMMNLL